MPSGALPANARPSPRVAGSLPGQADALKHLRNTQFRKPQACERIKARTIVLMALFHVCLRWLMAPGTGVVVLLIQARAGLDAAHCAARQSPVALAPIPAPLPREPFLRPAR